jgi:hypothetical protein
MAKTNSIVNEIYAAAVVGQPAPEVGMGITLLHWTDRSAGTITRVSPSGKMFWFQSDRAVRTDKNGMSESQTYEYTPQPDARVQTARLNKKGQWVSAGTNIRIGDRRAYHDFSH